jgi:hypothetical protein
MEGTSCLDMAGILLLPLQIFQNNGQRIVTIEADSFSFSPRPVLAIERCELPLVPVRRQLHVRVVRIAEI